MTAEGLLHQQVADYMRLQHGDAIFRTDYAAGMKLVPWKAAHHKRLQSGRAYPDLFIAAPEKGHPSKGLFIELKAAGRKVYLKDGRTLVADPHIREQHDMLMELRRRGYTAHFCCGFDEAKSVIDAYLGNR